MVDKILAEKLKEAFEKFNKERQDEREKEMDSKDAHEERCAS